MCYHVDMDRLSLSSYRTLLTKQNLLPGRRLLHQNIDRHFALLENRGIRTAAQLYKALRTPVKRKALAEDTGIPEEYLTLLNRELGSLAQKPVPLASFPDILPARLEELHAAGLQTSRDVFEQGQATPDDLWRLCDLVRINGVGPAAAMAFLAAGYRSVADVAAADAAQMLGRVTAVNALHSYYKAKLGLKDMQFCIDFASLLEEHARG